MPTALRSLTRRALATLVVGGLLGASVVVLGAAAPAAAANHTISGTVFRDFDGDGTFDTGNSGTSGIQNDVGIGGVTVTATDGRGASWPATTSAVTATLGTYSITVADPYSTSIRVSFTNVPSAYKPSPYSTGSKTSVQFVTVGASAVTANYAVNVPEDYAQNNAPLVTAIQWAGLTSSSVSSSPTIVSTPWSQNYTALASGTSNPAGEEPDWAAVNYPGRTTLATVAQTGSVWSTVYDPTGNAIYAAAVYKRHAGMGPLGIGGIYKVSNALASDGTVNASATVSSWLNVSTLVSVGSVATDATRGLDEPADPARDEEAFRLAGKVGIGGLAISGGYLYFVNLADKLIYRINLSSPSTAPVSYNPGFTTGERPWALTVYRGDLYVGYATTGETASGANPGVSASTQSLTFGVKKASLTSLSTWTSVLSGSQGYARAEVAPGAKNQRLRWNTWTDTWSWTANGGGDVGDEAWNYEIQLYPQAMLTDIAFDTDGYMHLGLADRTSMQGGNRNCSTTSCPANNPVVYETFSSGDYLVAAPGAGGAYTLESNGVVGTRTSTAGQAGGPGGLEFFKDRNALGTGQFHGENTLGSIATMMGSRDVVSTAYDPLSDIRVAGQNWFVLSTGAVDAGYQHNRDPGGSAGSTGTFQKGGGIGDIDLLAKAAPLQIGNRVWFDADQDGAQDADEPAVANLTVQLLQGSTVIGTTTTNASGEYYFSSASISAFIPNGGAYTVKFVKPTTGDLFTSHATFGTVPWSTVSFTTPNKAGVSDDVDSDAVTSASDGTIAYTAGNAGENDHTLDAGLIASRYFQVTKALDAAGGADTGASYAMTAQARDFRDDAFTLAPTDASFTLTVGETKTIAVPVGGDAIVAETTATGVATGLFSKTVSPSSWFLVAGSSGTPTAVTVTNRLYRPGSFTVAKAVTDLTGLVAGTPSFGLEYAINGSTTWTALSVNAGSTSSAISLPYGTTVKVREISRPAVAGGTWQTPTWAGSGVTTDGSGHASFTIGEDTTIAVTLTNPITRNNGSFTVQKVVSDPASLVTGTPSFGLEYAINGSSSWTAFSVTAGSTTSSVSLPYGTTVKVREISRPAVTGGTWGTAAWSGTGVTTDGSGYASFTIGDGTTVGVVLTNPISRNNGSFTVAKVVSDPTSLVTGTPSFGLEYAINGSSSWTAFSVTAGSTTSAVSLPYGTTVKVREVSRPTIAGGTWGTAAWSGSGVSTDGSGYASFTIGDATNVGVTLTNPISRNNGSFTVAKVVSDPTSLVTGTPSFGLEYAINGSSSWTAFSVTAGSTTSAISLPYGTTVKVREVSRPTVTGGSWGTPVWTGASTDSNNYASFTIGDGTTIGLTLTNPISRNNGDFTVTKNLTGETALVSGSPSFGLEYAINGSSTWVPFSVTAGSTTSAISLPYGTTVKVREVSRPSVTGGSWGTPVWTGASTDSNNYASFTIGDGTTVGLTLSNPINRTSGYFTVAKVLSGDGAALASGASFGLEYAINGSSSWTPFTVTAGTTSAAITLPYGTTVKVREVSRPSISGLSWQTPVWTGASVDVDNYASFTIGDGTTIGLTLTNPSTVDDGYFTVEKLLSGDSEDTALVPGDTEFTVEYTTDDWANVETLTLTPGQTSLPVPLPYGTIVEVREAARPDVEGVGWGTADFSIGGTSQGDSATFTIGDGTTVEVTLTNPVTRKDGSFTVAKTVTGATDLLSTPPTFGLEYAIDGSSSWTPFTVTAGSTTAAITLPYGTSVKIREVDVPAVTGGTWGTPTWSGVSTDGDGYASFTIGDTTNVAVILTNPLDKNTGSFDVTKTLSGDATELADGTWLDIEYSTTSGLFWLSLPVQAGTTSPSVTLDYGTEVWLRENAGPSITGMAWGARTWTGATEFPDGTARFTIGDGTHVAIGLENETERVRSGFSVTKVITGDAKDSVPDDFEFTFHYSYLDGATPVSDTVTVSKADGLTATVTDVPFGATVTLWEEEPGDAAPDLEWVAPTYQVDGLPVTVDGDGHISFTAGATDVAVEVTNDTNRRYGSLEIAKVVGGSASGSVDADQEFTVHYSSVEGEGDLTVVNGSSVELAGVPAGTVVTLSELTPTVTAPDVSWLAPLWSGAGVVDNGDGTATVTVAADTEIDVTLTNPTSQLLGRFTVEKSVIGEAAALADEAGPFTVEYQVDGSGPWIPLTIADGETSDPVELPTGTVVTVREDDPDAVTGVVWGVPIWGGPGVLAGPGNTASFTIGDDTTVEVGLENPTTFVDTGFSVTKTVSGDARDSIVADFPFAIDYSYTTSEGLQTGTLHVTKLSNVDSLLSGVPYGTVVTLEEVAPTGAPADVQWETPEFSGDSVTDNGDGTATFIADDTLVEITLDNPTTRLYGDLEITKDVSGSAEDSVLPEFEFTVHYEYPGGSGDVTVVDGGTASIPDLPAGTVVTLSEAPRVGAPADVEWQTPEWTLLGADGAVTDNGDGTATVTVIAGATIGIQLENPTEQLLNGFSVTKSVTGEHPESVPADFEFSVHYSSDAKSGDLVLTTGGGAESVEDLPLGTVVTLSEVAPVDGEPVDVDWGAPQWSGTDLTIDGDGNATFTVGAAPIAILLENPTTRLYGGFSIAKEVTGAGKRILADEYGFHGSYVYDGIDPQDFTVEAGETWTLPGADQIPAGTVVTIAELEPTAGFPDMALTGWEEPIFRIGDTEVGDDGIVQITIEADTEIELELENPTWVTPLIDIEKGDGAGGVIQHDADTMDDSEYYEPGETRRIEFVVTNPGTEDLREVVLTDRTLSGAQVSAIEWTFPDDSTADASLVSGVWTAQWDATFGTGTSRWVPGDVIHGVATLTVEASEVAHVDRAHVEAVGADSGTEVEDSDDYNAFTGEIQVIKYDGRLPDPAVQSGGDWVAPAKPLADPFQDANDLAHAAQSIADVPVEVHWVVSNVGTTTLTDVMVTDTTLEGPDIEPWTCDLSDFGGPAAHDFVHDGAWTGLLPPSASFFCSGFVTLKAGQWHTDRVDVTAHVIEPEVDNAGLPTGNPKLISGVPVLARDAGGELVVVDDDDPFYDPAARELAYTGANGQQLIAIALWASASVLLGLLFIVLPKRRRRGMHLAR